MAAMAQRACELQRGLLSVRQAGATSRFPPPLRRELPSSLHQPDKRKKQKPGAMATTSSHPCRLREPGSGLGRPIDELAGKGSVYLKG
jgi:hypothetical protein